MRSLQLIVSRCQWLGDDEQGVCVAENDPSRLASTAPRFAAVRRPRGLLPHLRFNASSLEPRPRPVRHGRVAPEVSLKPSRQLAGRAGTSAIAAWGAATARHALPARHACDTHASTVRTCESRYDVPFHYVVLHVIMVYVLGIMLHTNASME